MTRILVIVVGFILYGSLYPWHSRPGPGGVSPLHVLLHSWPREIAPSAYSDVVVNLLLYIPVGMFGFFALDRSRHRWLRWVLPVVLAFVLSATVEMLQVYDITRNCSLLDLFDNTISGIIGVGLGWFFRISMSAAIFLVLHWLGYQVCVLYGVMSGRRPGLRMPGSPLETISIVAAWSMALYLLAVIPTAERKHRSAVWLAVGFTALLIARGLAPFHFQTSATPFNWIPFSTILQQEWIVGLPIFLEKSFFYGTALWLIHSSGWSLRRATILVASVLAIMEVIQRHLPGRTPEITDPLLAIVVGFSLSLIERDYRRIKHLDILQLQT